MIQVDGSVQASPKAQRGVEVIPTHVEILSKAEVPLPLGVADKVGAELDTRLNHRVIDLRKPAVRAIFELRTALLEGLRQSFLSRGFLEVETPKLLKQGAEGGATMFAVDYFDTPAFLAQSPQLYKQMLMSAGFERVFEIAPAFRAEPSDTVRHLTEFSSVDGEIAFIQDGDDVRQVLEAIVADTLATARTRLAAMGNPYAEKLPTAEPPFPRITFTECEELLGRPGAEKDFGAEDEKRLGEILVERFGNPFYFLTDFPTSIKIHDVLCPPIRRAAPVRRLLRPRLSRSGAGQRRPPGAPDGAAHGQYPGRRRGPRFPRGLLGGLPLRDAPSRRVGVRPRPLRHGAGGAAEHPRVTAIS